MSHFDWSQLVDRLPILHRNRRDIPCLVVKIFGRTQRVAIKNIQPKESVRANPNSCPQIFIDQLFTVFEFYEPNSCSWIRPEFIFGKNLFRSVFVGPYDRYWHLWCQAAKNFHWWKADWKDTAAGILFYSHKQKNRSESRLVGNSNYGYNQSYCCWVWSAGLRWSHGHLKYEERSWCSWSTTSPCNHRGVKSATTSAAKELTNGQHFSMIGVGNFFGFWFYSDWQLPRAINGEISICDVLRKATSIFSKRGAAYGPS